MEPVEEPLVIATGGTVPTEARVVYTSILTVWEVDFDSFCIGGRRFWSKGHHLNVHDRVKVTIEKLSL